MPKTHPWIKFGFSSAAGCQMQFLRFGVTWRPWFVHVGIRTQYLRPLVNLVQIRDWISHQDVKTLILFRWREYLQCFRLRCSQNSQLQLNRLGFIQNWVFRIAVLTQALHQFLLNLYQFLGEVVSVWLPAIRFVYYSLSRSYHKSTHIWLCSLDQPLSEY